MEDKSKLFQFQSLDEAILAGRTLLYLRFQKERFGLCSIPGNPDSMSPSMIAYLKHDINELLEKGEINSNVFGRDDVNCEYVIDKLPKILEGLVSLGYMERDSTRYVLKPLTTI